MSRLIKMYGRPLMKKKESANARYAQIQGENGIHAPSRTDFMGSSCTNFAVQATWPDLVT